MWRRASGLRRGFASQFASAFIIDDIVVAAPGTSSSRLCAAAETAAVLHPPLIMAWPPGADRQRRGGAAVGVRGRGVGPGLWELNGLDTNGGPHKASMGFPSFQIIFRTVVFGFAEAISPGLTTHVLILELHNCSLQCSVLDD